MAPQVWKKIEPVAARHPPARAPLVAVGDEQAVVDHLAAVGPGCARHHDAHVAAEGVRQVGLDLGQLLVQVADARLDERQAQRRAEGPVSENVDPGLARAAQVERDPVGHLVGERGADARPRGSERLDHGRVSPTAATAADASSISNATSSAYRPAG
jgi:hypothetical protein